MNTCLQTGNRDACVPREQIAHRAALLYRKGWKHRDCQAGDMENAVCHLLCFPFVLAPQWCESIPAIRMRTKGMTVITTCTCPLTQVSTESRPVLNVSDSNLLGHFVPLQARSTWRCLRQPNPYTVYVWTDSPIMKASHTPRATGCGGVPCL